MKLNIQNKLKALISSFVLGTSMELLIYYPEWIAYIMSGVLAILLIMIMIFIKFSLKSFAKINFTLTSILFISASLLMFVFVPEFIYKQLYIGFFFIAFFYLISKFMEMKVYEIHDMAYEQQYSYVDFILMITSFLLYSGFFGLYLYLKFPLWMLLIMIFFVNALLFFLFFYFNDLWLGKMWLYVFVLTFIMLEISWALSYWPNGLLGRGIVLFFAYYILSGLSKHYLKESFHLKVLREYLFVGIAVLLLVLSTGQWTY